MGLVHAAQDLAIGVYKQTCKILLPAALYESILVTWSKDVACSMVDLKVVVSAILRLAADVWPLRYRDPKALPLAFGNGNLHHSYNMFCTHNTTGAVKRGETWVERVILANKQLANHLWRITTNHYRGACDPETTLHLA